MQERDLLRLKPGSYPATDGIWKYSIDVETHPESGKRYFKIRVDTEIYRDFVYLSVHTESYNDNWDIEKLYGCMSIGGMSIVSSNVRHVIGRLEFTPRGSFKRFEAEASKKGLI